MPNPSAHSEGVSLKESVHEKDLSSKRPAFMVDKQLCMVQGVSFNNKASNSRKISTMQLSI